MAIPDIPAANSSNTDAPLSVDPRNHRAPSPMTNPDIAEIERNMRLSGSRIADGRLMDDIVDIFVESCRKRSD